MYIHDLGTKSVEGLKEIKVRIPTGLHWKLHTMKLASGQQISITVRDALALYFDAVFPETAPRSTA